MNGLLHVLAVDPLLAGDIGLAEVLIVLLKVVVTFVLLLVSVLFMVWFERKVHADMRTASARTGPGRSASSRRSPTASSSSSRRTCCPTAPTGACFILAPFLSVVPAFLVFSVIPIGGDSTGTSRASSSIFGHDTYLQLADPPIGILLILACSSIAVYGVMLAGWSSGSKYPLLGSVRASAQMVSYEAALGLSVVAVVLLAGSLSTHDIVLSQAGDGFGHPPALEPDRHRRGAVRDLPHRRHGRDEPPAVRPRRGRAGARRRLPHRVLLDPLRPVKS